MEQEKIVGTNCYNCMWIAKKAEPVEAKELNAQGGIDPKNKAETQKAKQADLITLPGGTKADATNKKFCDNEAIKLFVTVRMCCGYWDNAGVKRPWKTKI